jgi:hypothetical protein
LSTAIELRFYSRDTLYDHHAVRAGSKRDGLFNINDMKLC